MNILNRSIWTIDWTLTNTTTPSQSQWRCTRHFPEIQNWSLIIRCSLLSYPWHLIFFFFLWWGNLTSLQSYSQRILIPVDRVHIISIDKIKENGFEMTKKRSRRYPAKTITDADYADDIAILANTPNQAETLLHSFERATVGIGLHVNAHKSECMCFNETGDISTLGGASLKLVDKFTYQGSSVSSTEKDIDTRLTKAWTAIDKLSIIGMSYLTDKNAVSSRQRSYRYCYMDALLGR